MDRRDDLRKIINEALELPRERWPSFLDERCGGDAALRDEALRDLSEASQLGSFLAQSAREDTRAIDLDRTRSWSPPPAPEPASTVDTAGSPAATSASDDSRPTYELLEVLGQGGFGIVFRANQLTPVRRPVAIKYLRPERAGVHHGLRFEAERQALASLSHPGIAKLLDAGQTPDGRQFFSMEYVEGEPLDRFCDRRRLGIRARLELLIQVCEAIQHAHFRGIIHRDLKPANILAFEQEGAPVVRVIDLGLAFATAGPLTEGSRLLHEGPGTGTPTYMSPEQWSRPAAEIDTRTDVYSLGVVLYELLVGELPIRFDPAGGLADFGRALAQLRPADPSGRFLSLPAEERREVAAARGMDPARLARQLDSDLDAIARRALAKDPADRFATPGEIAAEIRRNFAHEPLESHPPSLRYRTRKFLRRNRVAVLAAAAILLTATIGLGATSAFWAVAREERALSQILGDRDTVSAAPARLEELWPLGPAAIEPLEAERRRLVAIEDRRPRYERRSGELTEELAVELARRDGGTADLTRFRLEVIQGLLAAIASFRTDDGRDRFEDLVGMPAKAERGLLAEIDWRLAHARSIDARTRTGAETRAAWAIAAREIGESPRYAGMPPIVPQLGLLPVGLDPGSGLAEFWHVPSGGPPERDAKGRIRMRPADGIVLVLIPGGRYAFGCENPLGLHVASFEGILKVTDVIPGSAAASAGIVKGDEILAAGGRPLPEAPDLLEVQRSLLGGGEIALRVRSAGNGSESDRHLVVSPPGPTRIHDLGAQPLEGPTQTIELAPFFISKFEVTQAQWARWTGANPSTRAVGKQYRGRAYTADQPVESISWEDARRICLQMGLRLPSDAQWEVAARGGTLTPWPTGVDVRRIEGHANVADRQIRLAQVQGTSFDEWLDDGFPMSAPVGSFEANGFGLHDAMGNVWEWCSDGAYRYDDPERSIRPGDGVRLPLDRTPTRSIRGGGYLNVAGLARSAVRWNYKTSGDGDVGLRPARPLDDAGLPW